MIIPEKKVLKKYVIDNLVRYWPQGRQHIESLPIPQFIEKTNVYNDEIVEVELPKWAENWGVNGRLIAPRIALANNGVVSWENTDWFLTAFYFMNGVSERHHEQLHGSIHSYSYKLMQSDPYLWEYAWVNRIALFLRAWVTHISSKDECDMFGKLPKGKVFVTHDVDAVTKTFPIRGKQAIFQLFNAVRFLCKGQAANAAKKINLCWRFLFSFDDYWCFEQLLKLEKKYKINGYFFFYGGMFSGKRTVKQYIIDPGYDVHDPQIVNLMKFLVTQNCLIGLHQSVDSWNASCAMKREKIYIEENLEQSIKLCRQHWLRFSWKDTWKNQEGAELSLDMTLGFNDRPGFRNGMALSWHPWDFEENNALNMQALPMVIMDSHFYDYYVGDEDKKWAVMKRIIDEIYFVGGEASVIWHPHTLSNDYHWNEGFEKLLSYMRRDDIEI